MGGVSITYKEEITGAMEMLAQDKRVIFIGQGLWYHGHAMYSSLEGIPRERKIELPVIEDVQMGMSIGLSLKGYIPVSIYPRMDFLIIAMNQLVNHLDKIAEMTHGEFKPKVIIRTMVGSKFPLDGGLQHTQDHTKGLREMLAHISILAVVERTGMDVYSYALKCPESVVTVEYGDLYK